MLVSRIRFLMVFGSESGYLGLEKPSIRHWRYCKNQLTQKLDLSWTQCPFFMVLNVLGTNFHDFFTGDWLDIWWLFKVILEHRRILATRLVEARRFVPGPSNNNSRIPQIDSRDPETKTASLETEKRVHTIHDTWETGSQIILRSLVCPNPNNNMSTLVYLFLSKSNCQPETPRPNVRVPQVDEILWAYSALAFWHLAFWVGNN